MVIVSNNKFVPLEDLEVYKLAREFSKLSWSVYDKLDTQNKIILGSQFIRAVDSVGANIAEGFGRYHFLDKIRFFYNSRGSLYEAKHWLDLLLERDKIAQEIYEQFKSTHKQIEIKLNNLISVTYKNKTA